LHSEPAALPVQSLFDMHWTHMPMPSQTLPPFDMQPDMAILFENPQAPLGVQIGVWQSLVAAGHVVGSHMPVEVEVMFVAVDIELDVDTFPPVPVVRNLLKSCVQPARSDKDRAVRTTRA